MGDKGLWGGKAIILGGEAKVLTSYGPVAVAIVLAVIIAGAMVFLSRLLGALEAKPKRGKFIPYECGSEPIGDARQRFPVKFYVIAMLFIIFDIEVVFFYPWAVVYRQLGAVALIAMGLFLLVLVVGYLYLLRIGAFEWEWWEREISGEPRRAQGRSPFPHPIEVGTGGERS